ncbi:MFS transporter [Actinacidiphila epipremni]|uniref:MFS transporter n=1 Tax=Actinacidiphila epipremni TaxID=2053013 RepID=A0ABX0ZLV8_9ACTN|nr:MFS transporter [Actinacidiphila epipremni]NJP43209.1 MFS transporter [Actinacidiphila epipremni]
MSAGAYGRVLRVPGVVPVLLAGMAVRVPWGAAGVVVVLHVVDDLHRGYGPSGVVAAVLGIATALGSPWRGRLLQRAGVRRGIGPSLPVLALAGLVTPWVGYWPLLGLTAVTGVLALPALAVVRAALDAAVDGELRGTVMALDAIGADLAFLLGPACGIALATAVGDRAALAVCLVGHPLGGLLLCRLDPALGAPPRSGAAPARGRGAAVLLVPALAMAFACAVVDSGGELSTIAAMKGWHRTELTGLTISLWAVGSVVGGVVYGAVRVRPSSAVLTAGLAVTLAATAAARGSGAYALLLGLNGLFVAPAYAAISADVTAAVPAGRAAEALSRQSGAMVLGGAFGTPAAGLVIDAWGWPAGLLLPAAVAALALLSRAATGPGPGPAAEPEP